MKRRHFLFLFSSALVVALLVSGFGLRVWHAKRRYALDRELIAALVYGGTRQALALVEAGADPNTRYNPPPGPTLELLFNQLLHRSRVPDDDSPTAFLIACGGSLLIGGIRGERDSPPVENVSLVRAMLAHGADIKTSDIHNRPVLDYAVLRKHRHVAQLLLQYGANVNTQSRYGSTALIAAVSRGDADMIRLLLEHGADVFIQDCTGHPALFYAVSCEMPNRTLILHHLLSHGANPNQADGYGGSALTEAQRLGLPDVVALLRKGGKQHKRRSAQGWSRKRGSGL